MSRQPGDHRRKRTMRVLAAVLVLAGVMAVAPAARASTASIGVVVHEFSGAAAPAPGLSFVAAPGEVNRVTLRVGPGGEFVVHDSAGVSPGQGCARPNPADGTTVACRAPAAAVMTTHFELGNMTDRLAVTVAPGSQVRVYALAGSGNDSLTGGPGNDELYGWGPGRKVIRGGPGDDGLAGGDSGSRLYGGAGNDQLGGGKGSDHLYGEAGNDMLDGGWGNDRLFGGPGNDIIEGGRGSDRLFGGLGRDVLVGGSPEPRPGVDYGRDVLVQ